MEANMEPQGIQNPKNQKKRVKNTSKTQHSKSRLLGAFRLQNEVTLSPGNRSQNHNDPKNPQSGPPDLQNRPGALKIHQIRDSDLQHLENPAANCLTKMQSFWTTCLQEGLENMTAKLQVRSETKNNTNTSTGRYKQNKGAIRKPSSGTMAGYARSACIDERHSPCG